MFQILFVANSWKLCFPRLHFAGFLPWKEQRSGGRRSRMRSKFRGSVPNCSKTFSPGRILRLWFRPIRLKVCSANWLFSVGINMNKEKATKWELAPIPLAGHDKTDEVVYWRRVGSPPAVAPTDIPLHPTCIVEYTGRSLH